MFLKLNSDLIKRPDESINSYIQRLCVSKNSSKLTWDKIADILNSEFGYTYSESYYRKHFNHGDFLIDDEINSDTSLDTGNLSSSLDNAAVGVNTQQQEHSELLELQKAKVNIADICSQNRAYVRKLAREETIKEIAHDYACTMSSKKLLATSDKETSFDSAVEGILLLSDWHYGMICNNSWNQYNPEACRERVTNLLNSVIRTIKKEKISKLTVLNLSDLIAGRIHTQIRIESRFDVITQIMDVSEILAELLNELSRYCAISYYDCLDNHSRLEPNKSESLDLESLVRIIPWYLKERLEHNKDVVIGENKFGADIITCNVLGHSIIAVHGDKDNPTTALERLSLMTHHHYDLLCTAHLHHFSANEQHQSLVVSNGSLMGVDSYAEKLRLTSDPSQTIIIVTPENVCESIKRIKVV